MYSVGQGDNIKEGRGKVFTLNYPDTIANTKYPCHSRKPENDKRPQQIPLGEFDKSLWNNYNGYDTVENYVPTTQQTKAGEISDGKILFISVALLLFVFVMYFIMRK